MPHETKKKVPGEPGIYRLPDGRFHVMIAISINGRRKYRRDTLAPGATLAQAREVKETLRLVTQDERTLTPSQSPVATVRDYAVQWFEDYSAQGHARSTLEVTEQILADHILPELGDLHIGDLNRAAIQRWVATIDHKLQPNGKPYGLETKRGWWRKLKHLAQDAHADGWIPGPDPTNRVTSPRRGGDLQQEQRTLDQDALRRFIEAFRQHAPHRVAELLVFAATAARSGEVYALLWPDITVKRQPERGAAVEVPLFDPGWSEFELRRHQKLGDIVGGRVHIQRAHFRGTVGKTKSKKGQRTVPLPVAVLEELELHAWRLRKDEHVGLDSGLVFPNQRGALRTGNSMHGPMRVAAKRAGLDMHVSPRVLRRTLNTLLVESGIDRAVTRSILGHATHTMTDHYAEPGEAAKRTAIEGVLLGAVAPGCCSEEK